MQDLELKADELESLEPGVLTKYLINNAWVKVESKSKPEYSVWQCTFQSTKRATILLPLDKEVPDFVSRVYDAIRVLAVVEHRSLSNVVRSLKATQSLQ